MGDKCPLEMLSYESPDPAVVSLHDRGEWVALMLSISWP